MSENLFLGDSTYPHTPSEATIKVEIDTKRADALAAVIKDLCRLVTTDHETKQDFIDSVKKVLGDDPDLRVSRLHDRIEQLERELAEAKNLSDLDALDLAVGRQIHRAARDLPMWFGIVISIEKDAGDVVMTDPDGNEFGNFEGDSFACEISKAIDAAIKESK